MKKRFITLLLICTLVMSLFSFGTLAAGSSAPFTDLESGAYYYDPVLWAVDRGITTGTSATTFSPNAECTRAQVVTFLWRAMGKPTASGACPFSDVKSDAFYYDAVLWAAGTGVTTGTSATTFSPDDTVTRGQFVTFLWRALGKPAPASTSHPFSDITDDAFYYQAVLWAFENGITTGMTATTFGPAGSCTRGQCVTFLSRALNTSTPSNPKLEVIRDETISRTVTPTDYDPPYWRFEVLLTNTTNKTITLKTITTQNLHDGAEVGTPYVDDTAESGMLSMFDLVCEPGTDIWWVDDHPVTYSFNGRRYVLEFEDTAGKKYTRTYLITYSYEGYSNPDAENAAGFDKPAKEMSIYYSNSDRWDYELWFRNDTGKSLHIKRMECTDYNNGALRGPVWVHDAETLANFFIPQTLSPGQIGSFMDGHPYVTDMDRRIYRITYADANDTEYTVTFDLKLLDQQEHPELDKTYIDYSGDNGKNAHVLRHNANYCVEIDDGVYWVPSNTLGSSSYTNAQIQAMLTNTPEQKQTNIDTLYEALQLFKIGGFYGSDDNVWIPENGIYWEHHKPGYHAVRTNNGCCATCSNWLHYILKDDYDEVGYFAWTSNSGGHIFNYIKEDGYYYFIDLTAWCNSINVNAVESGNMSDFYAGDPIGGVILRTSDMATFVDYVREKSPSRPTLFYTYRADDVIPAASIFTPSGDIEFHLPSNADVTVLYDDPTDNIFLHYSTAPTLNKDWSRNEGFLFDEMKFE